MRTILFALSLAVMAVFSSCNSEDNHGYPEEVNFPKEGGTKTAKGDESFAFCSISDYDGNESVTAGVSDGEVFELSYEWLTIRSVSFSKELTIIAQPSESNKKRVLYINGNFAGNEEAEIKVVQQ